MTLATLERALAVFESEDFAAMLGVASSYRLARAIAESHPAMAAAVEALATAPQCGTMILGYLADYQRNPGDEQYEHPKEAAAFACLLVLERVLGPTAPVTRLAFDTAKNIPRTWWTRQLVEEFENQNVRPAHSGS